jgi:hypothetical protein
MVLIFALCERWDDGDSDVSCRSVRGDASARRDRVGTERDATLKPLKSAIRMPRLDNIHERAPPLQLLADRFTWCRESHARLISPSPLRG